MRSGGWVQGKVTPRTGWTGGRVSVFQSDPGEWVDIRAEATHLHQDLARKGDGVLSPDCVGDLLAGETPGKTCTHPHRNSPRESDSTFAPSHISQAKSIG